MAIPRRVGLPTQPPAAQNDTNSSETPVKRPISQDNNNSEQRPVRRESAPQKRENQASSASKEQNRQRKNLQQSSKPQRRVVQDSEQNTPNQNPPRRKSQNEQVSTKVDNVSNRQKRNPENSDGQINTKNTDSTPVEEGYAIDEKTGVKYKVLPGAKPEAVKKFNSMKKADIDNLTFSSMKYFFTEAEDFDIEDLNNTAQDFLGHLRIPPDKDEQKRLREARAQRMKAQEEAYKKNAEKLDEKYGSLEPDDPDDE